MVVIFSVAVVPTRFMESQSYFNCGRRVAQFHPIVIAVSPASQHSMQVSNMFTEYFNLCPRRANRVFSPSRNKNLNQKPFSG